MTEGNGVVPMSWGNLGSQLMELGIVEPSVEAVCDFLSIEPEDLRDPYIVIEHHGHVSTFRQRLSNKYEEQFRSEHGPSAQRDADHFLALRESWRVEHSNDRADGLVEALRKEANAIDGLTDQDEYAARSSALNLRVLEHRALKSGYVLSAADLVRAALSYDSPQYFSQEDIVKALSSTLDNIIYDNLLDANALLEKVIIGGIEVGYFLNSLQYTFSDRMREGADAQWKPIGALLMPGTIYEHPLLAGNEK